MHRFAMKCQETMPLRIMLFFLFVLISLATSDSNMLLGHILSCSFVTRSVLTTASKQAGLLSFCYKRRVSAAMRP
jgi:hypothetical protein